MSWSSSSSRSQKRASPSSSSSQQHQPLVITETIERAASIIQRAFKKHKDDDNNNNKIEKVMDLLNKSPPTTPSIRKYNRHWQEFIDREQNTMDHLIQDSFAVFCKDLKENIGELGYSRLKTSDEEVSSTPTKPEIFSTNSLNRSPVRKVSPPRVNFTKTMPRQISTMTMTTRDPAYVPPGIKELESLYAPMKNLSQPLKNSVSAASGPIGDTAMPSVYPLRWSNPSNDDDDDDDEVLSEAASIPPCLPPIQSHAVLEETLGHAIPPLPRTPARIQKFIQQPPLPPKRTISKLRPTHLNLNSSIYSKPNSNDSQHRTSLMSTGSSESSGSSSIPSFETTPATPSTPTSENKIFSWADFHASLPSPPPPPPNNVSSNEEHRSVSQIGGESSECSETSTNNNRRSVQGSEEYVKMQSIFPVNSKESHYMNMLYSAVQRQGGRGSVESAISPYLSMKGIDTISAIYAQPQFDEEQSQEKKLNTIEKKRRKKQLKALAEFKELMEEVERKRSYRVGLNLFNSKPDYGIEYLVTHNFLELSPPAVAKFLYECGGLSKEKIGEYLGNLQSPFSMKVLSCFIQLFNFSGQRIDKSMRKLLDYMRVPGEAQKIEKIMEVFGKHYNKCNPSFASKLKSADSVVTLSFAIMLLNTDLHTPSVKADKKMTVEDFLNNLRGVDAGRDFTDQKLLKSIYKGIKKQEFIGGADHVLQTQLIQKSINKCPQLTEPHRRLVCLCRLSEVMDINSRKEAEVGLHPRDIFLFNDILVVTKQSTTRSTKNNPIYSFKDSFEIKGVEVTLFHTPVYHFGIQITRKSDDAVLLTLNAGSEHDRYKFVMDLQESIFEMDAMQAVKLKMP